MRAGVSSTCRCLCTGSHVADISHRLPSDRGWKIKKYLLIGKHEKYRITRVSWGKRGMSSSQPLMGILYPTSLFKPCFFEHQAPVDFIFGCLDLQMSCRDLTKWQGTRIVAPARTDWWHAPFLYLFNLMHATYFNVISQGCTPSWDPVALGYKKCPRATRFHYLEYSNCNLKSRLLIWQFKQFYWFHNG